MCPSFKHKTITANLFPFLHKKKQKRFVIDLEDLERKADAHPDAKILMLSYMRGRVPDMDKLMEIVDRFGLYLIEDAAHAYGCEWKNKKIGTFGKSAAMSTQANKLINSGEGGFLLTNDDDVMARSIIHSGAYEMLMKKHHELSPPMELMLHYRFKLPNYSIRMTNLQGAIILPQVALIDSRRDAHNAAYERLSNLINNHESKRLFAPPQLSDVTPVYDSLQMRVKGLNESGMRAFAEACVREGVGKVAGFGWSENARNYQTWQFVADESLQAEDFKQTTSHIEDTLDARLPLGMTDNDVDKMYNAISAAFEPFWSSDDTFTDR